MNFVLFGKKKKHHKDFNIKLALLQIFPGYYIYQPRLLGLINTLKLIIHLPEKSPKSVNILRE